MSDERLNSNTASNHRITLELSYYGTQTKVEFNGSCLKQDKATHDPRAIVNIYIVHEISKNYNISSYPTLENCTNISTNILEMVLSLIEKGVFIW